MVLCSLPGIKQAAWDTQLAQPIGNKGDFGQLLHELVVQMFMVHQHLDHRAVFPVLWNAPKPPHKLPAIQQRSRQEDRAREDFKRTSPAMMYRRMAFDFKHKGALSMQTGQRQSRPQISLHTRSKLHSQSKFAVLHVKDHLLGDERHQTLVQLLCRKYTQTLKIMPNSP